MRPRREVCARASPLQAAPGEREEPLRPAGLGVRGALPPREASYVQGQPLPGEAEDVPEGPPRPVPRGPEVPERGHAPPVGGYGPEERAREGLPAPLSGAPSGVPREREAAVTPLAGGLRVEERAHGPGRGLPRSWRSGLLSE